MNISLRKLILPAALLLSCASAFADVQASAPVAVKSVRPHAGNNRVYVELVSNSVCATSVYTVNLARSAGKEMTAAAVAAFTTGKRLKVEVVGSCPATGSAAWGMELQSVVLE